MRQPRFKLSTPYPDDLLITPLAEASPHDTSIASLLRESPDLATASALYAPRPPAIGTRRSKPGITRRVMLKWMLIALGGAGGSMLRYALGGWVQTWTQASVHRVFPAGTIVINVLGCLVIGILATLFSGPVMVREEYRAGIIVGILGGFTTFSAFSWETNRLAADSEYWYASLNVLLSVGLGLVATWGGMKIAQAIWGP